MQSAVLNLYLVARLEDGTSFTTRVGNLAMAGLGRQDLINGVATSIGHLDNLSSLLQQQGV